MGGPSWDEDFFGAAECVGRMGTCDRSRLGTVLVKGKRALAMGFNGSAPGHPYCDEVGHLEAETAEGEAPQLPGSLSGIIFDSRGA